MCGRFTLNKKGKNLKKEFPEFEIDERIEPRFNIAPSQPIATVLNDQTNKMTFTQWGLIPHWAKDPNIAFQTFNARCETLLEKPSFKTPYKRKRCLIFADGYYEWRKSSKRGQSEPMYFCMQDRRSFAFAGLWDEWHDKEGGLIITSTIVTTEPNQLTKGIHHRMPVILRPEFYELWLSHEDKDKVLRPLFEPYASEEMEVYEVSTKVNSVSNDSPACIEPTGQLGLF